MIAVGWSELEDVPSAPPADDRAWLVTADLSSAHAATTTAIHHEFGDDNLELSPDGSLLATIERTEVVVRVATTAVERARRPLGVIDEAASPDPHRVCWLDDEHVAWIGIDAGAYVLRVASIHGAIASTPLAQPMTIVACDPAGDAAAVALADSIGVLDLANATIVATHAIDEDLLSVAVGSRGQRLAIASDRGVALFRRDGNALSAVFDVSKPLTPDVADTPRVAFSRDGRRLAISGATLVVIGDTTNAPAVAAVPTLAVDLPRGFEAGEPVDLSWAYGQLPVPSGRATTPALLFQARSIDDPYAHVIGLAIDRDELPSLPADSDDEMKQFAKRTMERWFDSDPERADYAIEVGRTHGKRWFETRELHREGCEPFDAYTRVVIDTHHIYVVRAVTVPGGSIDGWLDPFFDAPFRAHVKTALRRGPRAGPC